MLLLLAGLRHYCGSTAVTANFSFIISNCLTKCGNVLCAVVYIPPEDSAYAAESPYSEIKEELRHLTDAYNCTSVIMFGDYNLRVRNMQHCQILIFLKNEMYEELSDDLTCFDQNSRFVSLQRQNPDGGLNNYGYRLIDFCCENSFYTVETEFTESALRVHGL